MTSSSSRTAAWSCSGTPAEILAATGAPDLEEAFVRAADGEAHA